LQCPKKTILVYNTQISAVRFLEPLAFPSACSEHEIIPSNAWEMNTFIYFDEQKARKKVPACSQGREITVDSFPRAGCKMYRNVKQ